MSHKAAIIKSLLDEAFRVLQHDSPEDDPEYAHLRDTLGKSFWKVLKNAPIAQPAQTRALTFEDRQTAVEAWEERIIADGRNITSREAACFEDGFEACRALLAEQPASGGDRE